MLKQQQSPSRDNAAAAQTVQTAGDTQHAAVSQSVIALGTSIACSFDNLDQSLMSRAQGAVDSLGARTAAARGSIEASRVEQHSRIEQAVGEQRLSVTTTAATLSGDILPWAQDQSASLSKDGADYERQATEIGNERGAFYVVGERGSDICAHAGDMAAEAVHSIHENIGSIATEIVADGTQLSQTIRDRGDELSKWDWDAASATAGSQIDAAAVQALAQLDQSAAQIATQIDQALAQALANSAQARADALTQFDAMVAPVPDAVLGATTAALGAFEGGQGSDEGALDAAARIEALGLATTSAFANVDGSLSAQNAQVLTAFDDFIVQTMGASAEAAGGFEGQCIGVVVTAGDAAVGHLVEQGTSMTVELQTLHDNGRQAIEEKAASARARAAKVVAELTPAIDAKAKEILEQSWFERAASAVGHLLLGVLKGAWGLVKGVLLVLAVLVVAALVIGLLVFALVSIFPALLGPLVACMILAAVYGPTILAIVMWASLLIGVAVTVWQIAKTADLWMSDDVTWAEKWDATGELLFTVVLTMIGFGEVAEASSTSALNSVNAARLTAEAEGAAAAEGVNDARMLSRVFRQTEKLYSIGDKGNTVVEGHEALKETQEDDDFVNKSWHQHKYARP